MTGIRELLAGVDQRDTGLVAGAFNLYMNVKRIRSGTSTWCDGNDIINIFRICDILAEIPNGGADRQVAVDLQGMEESLGPTRRAVNGDRRPRMDGE
jgi:hypothetical protein